MNATMKTTKKTRKLCQDNSTHACSSFRDSDVSAQRGCGLPIHSRKEIPNKYERDNDDDKK